MAAISKKKRSPYSFLPFRIRTPRSAARSSTSRCGRLTDQFALLALGSPHEAAALTEWRNAAWPMMKDGSRVSTTPTAQLIGLWAHYVIPRERKIAHYSLQEGG